MVAWSCYDSKFPTDKESPMRKYYVGMDVHKLSIAIAVLDAYGKLVSRMRVIAEPTENITKGC